MATTGADHPRARYRMLVGNAERVIPAAGRIGGAAKLVAWYAGRSKWFPDTFPRAYRRLDRGQAVTGLRLEYAEGYFNQDLVVDIDPMRLDAMLVDSVSDGRRAIRLAHWFLDAGIWEDAVLPVADSEVDQEIAAVFEPQGYQSSSAYERLVAEMTDGRPAIRNNVVLDDGVLIDSYFRYYENLRESIGAHGVLRRDDLRGTSIMSPAKSPIRSRRTEEMERDVGVAIDETGRLIRMVGGRHRTAIAQRFRLRRFPVQVRLVHTRWLRDQIAGTGLSPERALLAGLRGLTET